MSRALLTRLEGTGALIEIIGDKLRIDVPKQFLTTELVIELKANKETIIQELKLADYQNKARSSNSLAELFNTLNEFCQYKWNICQQSDMSAAYTGRALQLIETEQVDKRKVLENLACLCWSDTNWQLDGRPATKTEATQIAKALGNYYGNGKTLRDDLIYQHHLMTEGAI